MHVKAKKMAFGGLLLALTIVCMVLGSVIESNTLFLLAAASYFVGIIIRETGMRTGAAFYIAAVLLGFIVANKIYVVSFAAMGFYILAVEQAFVMLGRTKARVNRKALFWAIKYIIFNILYIPALIVFQQLLFGRNLSPAWMAGLIAAGQAGLWIYDRAYDYVQRHIWNKLRKRLF